MQTVMYRVVNVDQVQPEYSVNSSFVIRNVSKMAYVSYEVIYRYVVVQQANLELTATSWTHAVATVKYALNMAVMLAVNSIPTISH